MQSSGSSGNFTLGMIEYKNGNYSKAVEWWVDELTNAMLSSDVNYQIKLNIALAHAQYELGDYFEATKMLCEAESMMTESQKKLSLEMAKINFLNASMSIKMGNFDIANIAVAKAISLSEKLIERNAHVDDAYVVLSRSLQLKTSINVELNIKCGAFDSANKAIAVATQIGDKATLCYVNLTLGEMLARNGETTEALKLLNDAIINATNLTAKYKAMLWQKYCLGDFDGMKRCVLMLDELETQPKDMARYWTILARNCLDSAGCNSDAKTDYLMKDVEELNL